VNEGQVDGRLRFVQSLDLSSSDLKPEDLIRRLDETTIAIVIGKNAALSLSAQVTALTAMNLLARLFRRLLIVVPSEVEADKLLPFVQGPIATALVAFASRVHPQVRAETSEHLPAGVVALHVAESQSIDSEGQVYCAGSGWLAHVGQHAVALPAGDEQNPVGPLIAAALGVAEVFKVVFGDNLRHVVPSVDITFSALTYKVGEMDPGPPLQEALLPRTALVGAGSIGSAFLWGLSHVREAQGRLVVVDHDRLESHNPDRAILVLDGAEALNPQKATYARDTIHEWVPHLTIEPFEGTIREYIDTLPASYVLPLAVSAVDSIESRRDIQDALPSRILNASTGPTKVEVSRHAAFGNGPCLYCLYLPEVLERSPIHIAMARTGFGQRDLAEFMLPDSNRPLTPGNIRGIEQHNNMPLGTLKHYAGRRLPELLESQVWYSQAPVQLDNGHALVTTAFVSALAGFLLLAEALKEAVPSLAPYRLAGIYEQELMGIPNEFLSPGKRDTTGYCLCHDPLRCRLYHEKYGF
jgi:hypothetical protein